MGLTCNINRHLSFLSALLTQGDILSSVIGLSRKGMSSVMRDARAETEWEKLAQNLQLKVGLQPPPPHPEVANWTGFAKKKFSFFSLRKSTKKKYLVTYY